MSAKEDGLAFFSGNVTDGLQKTGSRFNPSPAQFHQPIINGGFGRERHRSQIDFGCLRLYFSVAGLLRVRGGNAHSVSKRRIRRPRRLRISVRRKKALKGGGAVGFPGRSATASQKGACTAVKSPDAEKRANAICCVSASK